ncbi:MAG TPA: PAS domain-containing protein [Bryobacteraceae bacterium]|nr:PAS domain-containing protein [Bryobacteraceae bacterium]
MTDYTRVEGSKTHGLRGNAAPREACPLDRVEESGTGATREDTGQALRESERRFGQLADAIPHLVWTTDAEGRHEYFNHRWYEYTGTTLKHVRGHGWMTVLHPDDVEPTRERWRRSVESGEVYEAEYRLRSAAGDYRWFLGRAEPIRDASGRVARWFGTCTDIDDQRRAEEALNVSRERFDMLIGSVEVGVWYCDLPMRTLACDATCRRHIGLPPEAEVTFESFYAQLHPDDRERTRHAIRTSIHQRIPFDVQYRTVGDDGGVRWVRGIGRVFYSKDGHPVRFDGVTLDISEQKHREELLRESQERLQAALDASDTGIFRWDIQAGTLHWDDRLRRMFGLEPGDEMRDLTSFLRHVHPEDHSAVLDAIRLSAEAGADFELEFRTVWPDGSVRWIAEKGRTVCAPDGRPLYVTGACMDLTERRLGEEAMRQAQKLESLGVLAGGIAHDFNNLLMGIMGNASLVQESLPETHPDWGRLQGVLRASERAADLTRQLLAYAGKGQFLFEFVDLSALVREIDALIETSIPRRVKLVTDLADGLPLIEADRGQLQQVVMNLLLNGAEAVPEHLHGMVRVTTFSRRYGTAALAGFVGPAAAAPGFYVGLEVQDTGAGMDQATISRIFDPFFTTKFTGRGLGLSAVQGIVRACRGGMRVASAPGGGSTFTVLFPAASPDIDAPEAATAAQPRFGRGTILVVDDDALVRKTVPKALERYGYTVITAEDAQAGVEAFTASAAEIVLVVLDLTTPVTGAGEALRRIQAIEPEAPVLLSSGVTEADALQPLEGKPPAGFIQKPYSPSLLAEKVTALLLRLHGSA